MNKSATVAAVSFTALALTLGACGSDEGGNDRAEATAPGETATSPTASPTDAPDSNGDELSAQIINTDGAPVAEATLDFSDGFATVTVETTDDGFFTPGFHSMHIHQTGKCEPNSVGPDGGAPGDFKSAGEHLQAPGHTGHPASGDLPDLLVRSDGAGKQMITTDAFTATDLVDDDKAAIIIHERADIDGDKRIACGVIEKES